MSKLNIDDSDSERENAERKIFYDVMVEMKGNMNDRSFTKIIPHERMIEFKIQSENLFV